MRFLREIKKVGLVDWVWYTFWLRRDVFSTKLNRGKYYSNYETLGKARKRAYKIDDEIADLIFEGRGPLSAYSRGVLTGILIGVLAFYLVLIYDRL